MDEREFSSPVCYLDYDNEPANSESKLCGECQLVLNSLASMVTKHRSSNYDDVPASDYSETLCSRTDSLECSAKDGCQICITAYQDYSLENKHALSTAEGQCLVTYKYRGTIMRGETPGTYQVTLIIVVVVEEERSSLASVNSLVSLSGAEECHERTLSESSAPLAFSRDLGTGWSQKSSSQHEACSSDHVLLPSWLVEKGLPESLNIEMLRRHNLPPDAS